jgi:biotin transport system substrate-specific component
MSSPITLRRHGRNPLAAPPGARPVLADRLPGDRSRDFALAAGYALVVGLVGQLWLANGGSAHGPLDGRVPVTAQAGVVLIGAAALGWRRALAGMVAYALVGLAGVPWFADERAAGLLGAMRSLSFGYVLGFVIAAMVVGGLAARGLDRDPPRAAAMLLAGLAIIYGFGLPWLMASRGVGLGAGVAEGVVPFLPFDLGGVVAGCVLLPAARVALRRRDHP